MYMLLFCYFVEGSRFIPMRQGFGALIWRSVDCTLRPNTIASLSFRSSDTDLLSIAISFPLPSSSSRMMYFRGFWADHLDTIPE